MSNPIDPPNSRSDTEQQNEASTPFSIEKSSKHRNENDRRLFRTKRSRESAKIKLTNRELKAGMIRILGAAKAAVYLGLIRKDWVMRQEMLRLVVAHSIL